MVAETLCDLAEQGSHSLCLPATGGHFLLPGRLVESQVHHNDFEHETETLPGSLPLSLGRKERSCTRVEVTLLCALLRRRKRNKDRPRG